MPYLRSLPRANWSLAAEHSSDRPALSQAVQAGSFPSHLIFADRPEQGRVSAEGSEE